MKKAASSIAFLAEQKIPGGTAAPRPYILCSTDDERLRGRYAPWQVRAEETESGELLVAVGDQACIQHIFAAAAELQIERGELVRFWRDREAAAFAQFPFVNVGPKGALHSSWSGLPSECTNAFSRQTYGYWAATVLLDHTRWYGEAARGWRIRCTANAMLEAADKKIADPLKGFIEALIDAIESPSVREIERLKSRLAEREEMIRIFAQRRQEEHQRRKRKRARAGRRKQVRA